MEFSVSPLQASTTVRESHCPHGPSQGLLEITGQTDVPVSVSFGTICFRLLVFSIPCVFESSL